jgi:hypothetical protein
MADINKYIGRLNKIFNDNHWSRLFDELGFADILPNFVKMIGELSDDEADLVLTLTEDYLYIDANAMERIFREIYLDLSIDLITSYKQIYFLPLRAPSPGSSKTKSHSSVHYPAFHRLKLMCRENDNVAIESYDSMATLGGELSCRKECLIIFVDDFIGTGGSALKALNKYDSDFSKSTDIVAVMCAVCQEEGALKVKQAGYDVWTHHTRKKGLSESRKVKQVQKAIEIMSGISAKIIKNKDFHLGYLSSEALVTMPFRTPNNTFPIYWVDNNLRRAPFYR